jgi:hypothetical protein
MTVCTLAVGLLNGITIPVLLAASCEENVSNTILPTTMLMLAMFIASTVCLLFVGALIYATSMSSGIILTAVCALLCGVLTQLYRSSKARAASA